MQYLPGILKLQKYLFDHFHHQVGQETQLHDTIGKYKKLRKEGNKVILVRFAISYTFSTVAV